MPALRCAIIGIGGIGSRFTGDGEDSLSHAEAYMKCASTRLVAGCSPEVSDRDSFEKQFGISAHDCIEDMLSASEYDLVSICSPSKLHGEHVLQCLHAGVKAIWLEKPAANNLQELETLLEARRHVDARILVNYQRRYAAGYLAMKQAIAEEWYGKLHQLQVNYSKGLETNGSHMLDALLYLLKDTPDWQISYLNNSSNVNPSFVLDFAGFSQPVWVSGLDVDFHNIDLIATFETARVSLVAGGRRLLFEKRVASSGFPGYFHLDHDQDSRLPLNPAEGGLDAALADLVSAVEQKRAPLSTLETAKGSQAIIEYIRSQ